MDQQLHMCRDFTDMDIKDAFFSIPNFKSPGPDGFNSGFYKATWHKIRPMMCAAVREFFYKGSMPIYISETKSIMLPKVPHPQSVTDFRPMSCYNVIYKVITKLIGQRVKEILPSIIDQSQGPFVKGRELLYNMLIC